MINKLVAIRLYLSLSDLGKLSTACSHEKGILVVYSWHTIGYKVEIVFNHI